MLLEKKKGISKSFPSNLKKKTLHSAYELVNPGKNIHLFL
jgi:hypothetical protein